jgi:hypothetical protein
MMLRSALLILRWLGGRVKRGSEVLSKCVAHEHELMGLSLSMVSVPLDSSIMCSRSK